MAETLQKRGEWNYARTAIGVVNGRLVFHDSWGSQDDRKRGRGECLPHGPRFRDFPRGDALMTPTVVDASGDIDLNALVSTWRHDDIPTHRLREWEIDL